MRTWVERTALFVVAALLVAGCEAVVLKVGGNSRECFREDIPQGQNVKVLFQVLNGGDLSLDFEIDDPEGGRVHFSETRSDGRMDFRAAKSGFFQFCFDNHHSSADKELSVDIIVGELVDTGFAPNPDLLTPAEELVLTLSQGVQDVKYDQEYMYLRDVAHQNIANNTNRRVMMWFVFQLMLIVALGVWQVVFVTRFFEVKRIV